MGILGIVLLDLAMDNELINDMYIKISMYLLFPAISSYLALNFTGCTTFTNMSGVVKEMKIAVLLYIAVLIIAVSYFYSAIKSINNILLQVEYYLADENK